MSHALFRLALGIGTWGLVCITVASLAGCKTTESSVVLGGLGLAAGYWAAVSIVFFAFSWAKAVMARVVRRPAANVSLPAGSGSRPGLKHAA